MSTLRPLIQQKGKIFLLVGLVFVVALIVLQNSVSSSMKMSVGMGSVGTSGKPMVGYEVRDSYGNEMVSSLAMPAPDSAPQSNRSNRMAIQQSSLSLLVSNVNETKNKILEYATSVGGYMVTADIQEQQEAPTATITLRIPSRDLEQTLSFFRSQAIRVVSENLQGQDVTDTYVDIDKRIALLEKTKAQFEDILSKSREVSDITNVTREVLAIQSQIDQYVGQQESLRQNAELSKITIYLSTDEIALPYQPSEPFRPQAVFKQAVRSLVGSAQKIVAFAIWIGVFSIIWLPLLVVTILFLRRKNTTKK